jgi:hypothetical protein
MNTHDLAKELRRLADALESAPRLELGKKWDRLDHRRADNEGLPLNALVELSRFSKQEWLNLVVELGLEVDIRSRDASRDILGKVLKALEEQPEATERLKKSVKERRSEGSPELAKALSLLLK